MRNAVIPVINPALNRGTPPRPLRQSDIVLMPVKHLHSTWNLGDMLSRDSVENLWLAFTAAEHAANKRRNTFKSPHKR